MLTFIRELRARRRTKPIVIEMSEDAYWRSAEGRARMVVHQRAFQSEMDALEARGPVSDRPVDQLAFASDRLQLIAKYFLIEGGCCFWRYPERTLS